MHVLDENSEIVCTGRMNLQARLYLWTLGALCLLLWAGCSSDPPPLNGPSPPLTPVFRIETFLSNLNFPVTMAFAPDGRLFFNELSTGRVRVVENGQLLVDPFAEVAVETSGERGLLGLTFDPAFASNGFVYILHHTPGPPLDARVLRFTDFANRGIDQTIIVDDLASTNNHNGGNIGFGPDGMLYITIGDGQNPANSQDPDSLNGKILRFNPDGSIPATNPFGGFRAAFNLGLRNSFDFDFHPSTGTIYASENGPNCDDEINRIVPGGNYGWRPDYPCGDADLEFVAPLRRFTPTIAPTGVSFYTGSVFPQFQNDLFMVDFNSGRVQRFVVDETNMGQIVESSILVDGAFGALFDIVEGPDGFLYFSSSNAIHRIVPQ